jgi:hypothetical protein
MRVFSNVVRPCSASPEAPSTFIEHKELRQLLDAMIHAARLSFDKTSDLPLFAVALNDQGKIRQLTFPERPGRSADETSRFIETGLKMVAQQLTCKAVGFCSEVRFPDGSQAIHAEVVFILEHRDGCAYRAVIPDFLEPKFWNARRTEPRFFMRTFSASTRW